MLVLPPKQARFVEEYLVDLNATKAAERAGYSPRTAYAQGSRLLKDAEIAAAIADAQTARSEKVGVTKEWVLSRLVEIADRTMQKVAVLDGEGNPTGSWRFEPGPATRSLELLGKHLGMFPTKVEASGPNGGPIPTESVGEREIAMRLAFLLTKGPPVLDEILSRLAALPSDTRAEVEQIVLAATAGMRWVPSTGPQSQAYFSLADVLLYGGQGGGGKTDLGLGLGFTAHPRSLVMRRQYVNLSSLLDRAKEINGGSVGFNGSPPPRLQMPDGRLLVFGANNNPGDEQGFQGQPFDLKVFDEASQFLESQIRFHLGWLRTTTPGQRVRAVLATNPPIDATGDWIVGMFRPWLDITHPKPALPGELRFYVTAPDGTDLEVDGPDPVEIDGRKLLPMSRTFIPAAVKDNPYLAGTDYQAKLDGLPEPFRSAVRDGNFMVARADANFQVIPTTWILEAQKRWTADGGKGCPMTAMAYDPAGGGRDSAELAMRHNGWIAPLISAQGEETADGSVSAATIVRHRRDKAAIVVDVGGGYGGAVQLRLKDNQLVAVPFNGASASTRKTKDQQLSFKNKRSEAWWRLREELDPDQTDGSPIALPPDPELRADLAAPTWKLTMQGIQVESKDDLRKRLGRSPGKGDAVVMVVSEGDRAVREQIRRENAAKLMPTIRPFVPGPAHG